MNLFFFSYFRIPFFSQSSVISGCIITSCENGIPSLGIVHTTRSTMLMDVFNECLWEGTFPSRWKRARLALLAKTEKPVGVPSSYRPLCLPNDVGKIFKVLWFARVEAYMAAIRGGWSTNTALCFLSEWLISTCNACHYTVVVSLSIWNMFNIIRW